MGPQAPPTRGPPPAAPRARRPARGSLPWTTRTSYHRARGTFLRRRAGTYSRRRLHEARGELEGLGYGVTEGLFTAAEVGAPHRRQRLFVLARRLSDAERDALRIEPERGEGSARPAEPGYAQPGDLGEDVANAAGVLGQTIERRQPDRDDAGVADADRRQPPGRRADPGEAAGREPHRQPHRSGAGLADAQGVQRQQTERRQASGCRPRPSGAAVADTERSERRPGQPAGHVGDRTGAGRKQETESVSTRSREPARSAG